jgi:hypothetical protein
MSDRKPLSGRVVPDPQDPGMYRVQWSDGRLSDMTNLTRAKDAIAVVQKTATRRAQRLLEAARSDLTRQDDAQPREENDRDAEAA